MGQKHIFEVIWDYSILTFIKKKQANLIMSTACSRWRFLNIGVVCELYFALYMNLIAFFECFYAWANIESPCFHNLGEIEIVNCRLFSELIKRIIMLPNIAERKPSKRVHMVE